MSSRSPSPRQMLPAQQSHQQQLHFVSPSHYSYQKPVDGDAAHGYTAYIPARMPETGAVAFGSPHMTAQQCPAPASAIPALTTAPIQVAGIVDPTGPVPMLAPAGNAQMTLAHRHSRSGTNYRYQPYPHQQNSQHGSMHSGQAAALSVVSLPQTPEHAAAQSHAVYEQAQYMNNCTVLQPSPKSPHMMDSRGHSHANYQHEDQSLKQQQQQQPQQTLSAEFTQYSPRSGMKARRSSEVPRTPDAMEHHGMPYHDLGSSHSHAVNNSATTYISPAAASAGPEDTAPRTLHISSQSNHYDDTKQSATVSTPHQYMAPQLVSYENGNQSEQPIKSSPTGQLNQDSNLWLPANSYNNYDQHATAHASASEGVYRSRTSHRRSETLPSPSTSSHDQDDGDDSSAPPRYLPMRGQTLKPSDEFTTVPGRLSLLGSASKYVVTIGEIQRRLSPPECLNASLLGGVLRKAKARNGGTDLRRALEDIGLHLPPGRRKAAGTSMLTSLVEEEARSLASQFNNICGKMFPTAELASAVCRQHMIQSHASARAEERQVAIKHALQLTSELGEQLQAYLDQEDADRDSDTGNFPGLRQFSLITHSFGVLVVQGVLQVFQGYLRNLLKSTSGLVIRDHALQHQSVSGLHRKGHSEHGPSGLKQRR